MGTQTVKLEKALTTKTKGQMQDREDDETEDEIQDENEKTNRFLQSIPGKYARVNREAEGQPQKLLPLPEAPIGKNNPSIKILKPFSYPEVQEIKRSDRLSRGSRSLYKTNFMSSLWVMPCTSLDSCWLLTQELQFWGSYYFWRWMAWMWGKGKAGAQNSSPPYWEPSSPHNRARLRLS